MHVHIVGGAYLFLFCVCTDDACLIIMISSPSLLCFLFFHFSFSLSLSPPFLSSPNFSLPSLCPLQSWRRRWFCLMSSKVLEYYKSAKHSELKGVINLEDCESLNVGLFHKKYKHVFDLRTKDRIYYLVASSSDEMQSWVEIICNICNFSCRFSVIETGTLSYNLHSPCHHTRDCRRNRGLFFVFLSTVSILISHFFVEIFDQTREANSVLEYDFTAQFLGVLLANVCV